MADITEKEMLIEKGIHAGLGNEKFLEGVSLDNLKAMVKAVEDRDGEIELLKKTQKPVEEKKNITTVADLVKAGKIKSRPVQESEKEEFLKDDPKKGGKNGKEKA